MPIYGQTLGAQQQQFADLPASGQPPPAQQPPTAPQQSNAQALGAGVAQGQGGAAAGPWQQDPSHQANAGQNAGLWYGQQQATGGAPPSGPTWQQTAMTQTPGQTFATPAPTPQQPAPPAQSLMQQALAGGQSSPQQVSNFIAALRAVGAGGNNTFHASGPAPAAQQAAPLLSGVAGSNGFAGGVNYAGGFNMGAPNIGYNRGLGATGGTATAGAPPPGAGGGSVSQPMAPGGSGASNASFGAPPPTGYLSSTPWQQGVPGAGHTGPSGLGNAGAAQTPWPGLAGAFQNYQAPPPGPTNAQALGASVPALGYQGQQAFGATLPANWMANVFGPSTPPPSPPPPTNAQVVGASAPAANLGNQYGPLMSDANAKTGIVSDPEGLRDFVSRLGVHEYEYKDPRHGEGRFVSPMAQELERSEIGKRFVIETPEGKAVNYSPRMIGTMLSVDALLHREQTALEKRMAKLEARLGRRM